MKTDSALVKTDSDLVKTDSALGKTDSACELTVRSPVKTFSGLERRIV